MNRLSLVSYNVNGLKSDVKRKAIFTRLRSLNYDIIFLQETHCHLRRDQKRWSLEWDGQSVWSLGSNRSKGVTVLFNRNSLFNFENLMIDANGRYIVFDLTVMNKKFRMINLYAPNDAYERISFYNKLQTFVVLEHETLMSGDFNCALETKIDRINCSGNSDIGHIDLKKMISSFDLEDVYRRRNPEKRAFSWRRGNKASRIDYWLISRSLDNQVEYIDYRTCPFSDHQLVELKFRINETKHGKGSWKMNLNTIKTELFQKSFESLWKFWKTKKSDYSDINTWWDLGKMKIKKLAIEIGTQISKEIKDEIHNLEYIIKNNENNELNQAKVEQAKNDLKIILEHKGQGARVRSRVRWFEEGEQSTKYFYSLEKRNAKDKAWEEIKDENGQTRRGITDILETQVKFYSNLYTSEETNKQYKERFLKSMDAKLDRDDRVMLDEAITFTELSNALKKMKNNKSPGPDGIITEFYKMYWREIGKDLHDIVVHSFRIKELPKTQYLALIKLLFKKGNRDDLKNWRPISLLNTDLKIISKTLAERLKKVLPSIINTDQTGCIQGRFIGENISLIRDVIENCDDDQIVLLIDQQKAFDRVEFDWLFDVLRKFDFGEHFILWLEIMYKNMQSCISTNGYISRTFSINRGIRQGDSLSALLYILQSEPLSAYLRNTNRISGININGYESSHEIRNKHYVDDTFVCLENIRMTDECLSIIDEFGLATGSKLNHDKTIGLVMNNDNIADDETSNKVQLTLGPAKVLVVQVGKNKDNNIWNSNIEKITKKLAMWKQRNLSLTGKVLIIKSLGISQLIYFSDYLTIGENDITKLEKILYDFLWDGKKSRIRKEICVLPRTMGGIGMIDLRVALKVQRIKWIRRILKADENLAWTALPLKNFRSLDRKFGTDFFALRVKDSTRLLKTANLTIFYCLCIEAFQELCRKSKIQTSQDVIWCNDKIKFDGKPLEFAHWAKSNILYIKDIVTDGKLNECNIFDKLINKASFIFDLQKLKVSITQEFIQECEQNERNYQFDMQENCKKVVLQTQLRMHNGKNIAFIDIPGKELYNILLLSRSAEIRSKHYWQNKIGDFHLDFNLWFSCNFNNKIIPRKCIDFNWRYFHGQINTEAKLAKMKYSDGFCGLCKDEIENLEHLLYYCTNVCVIWTRIENVTSNFLNVSLNGVVILTGVLDVNILGSITNMIISIARWNIWKRRNLNKFESRMLSVNELYEWVKKDIIGHIDTLMKCKKIMQQKMLYCKLNELRHLNW